MGRIGWGRKGKNNVITVYSGIKLLKQKIFKNHHEQHLLLRKLSFSPSGALASPGHSERLASRSKPLGSLSANFLKALDVSRSSFSSLKWDNFLE